MFESSQPTTSIHLAFRSTDNALVSAPYRSFLLGVVRQGIKQAHIDPGMAGHVSSPDRYR